MAASWPLVVLESVSAVAGQPLVGLFSVSNLPLVALLSKDRQETDWRPTEDQIKADSRATKERSEKYQTDKEKLETSLSNRKTD